MEDKQLEEALAETIEKSFNDSELEDIMNEIENLEKEFTGDTSETVPVNNDNDIQSMIDRELESTQQQELADAIDQEKLTEAAIEAQSEEALVEMATDKEVNEIEDVFETSTKEELVSEVCDESITQEEIMAAVEDQIEATIDSVEVVEPKVEEVIEASCEVEDAFEVEDTFEVEDQIEANTDNVVSFEKPALVKAVKESPRSKENQIEFNASGSMDLNINFKVAGQIAILKVENGGLTLQLNGVELSISEETGCCVKMAGGVEFSVPLNDPAAKKNVA